MKEKRGRRHGAICLNSPTHTVTIAILRNGNIRSMGEQQRGKITQTFGNVIISSSFDSGRLS